MQIVFFKRTFQHNVIAILIVINFNVIAIACHVFLLIHNRNQACGK